jgi:hypothetical protein
MTTVVREEGDRLLRPKVAAQRTSTGLTATCGVSVSSSSCATFLSTSCRVHGRTVVRDEGDFPSGLVDDEEGETNYYDPTHLNKHVRDCHVWSPREVQAAAQLLVQCLAKVHGGTAERHGGDSATRSY